MKCINVWNPEIMRKKKLEVNLIPIFENLTKTNSWVSVENLRRR